MEERSPISSFPAQRRRTRSTSAMALDVEEDEEKDDIADQASLALENLADVAIALEKRDRDAALRMTSTSDAPSSSAGTRILSLFQGLISMPDNGHLPGTFTECPIHFSCCRTMSDTPLS